MQSFSMIRPDTPARAASSWQRGDAFIAGGTDLLQLIKNDVETPRRVIDLERLNLRQIAVSDGDLEVGALSRMAEVAGHPAVRDGWKMVSRALLTSASPQIRNMGTIGGNLLQRTRCMYFRDTGFACNKRQPGSGCPAIGGENRELAIFGGSENCIATHPSDLPVALLALDAELDLVAPGGGRRRIRLADFYSLPRDAPHKETVLRPGELIAAVHVPGGPVARNSTYLKVRDRTSFAFALCSAAVGLDVDDGVVRDARVAVGGVAPTPWRLPHAEEVLRGRRLDLATLEAAAERAVDGAVEAGENDFKIELTRRTVLRALRAVADQENL